MPTKQIWRPSLQRVSFSSKVLGLCFSKGEMPPPSPLWRPGMCIVYFMTVHLKVLLDLWNLWNKLILLKTAFCLSVLKGCVKTSLAAFLIWRVRSPREENFETVSMLELKQSSFKQYFWCLSLWIGRTLFSGKSRFLDKTGLSIYFFKKIDSIQIMLK